jgi:hypothetical protein
MARRLTSGLRPRLMEQSFPAARVSRGAAMDDWLRALGFERYEAAFRENDVDAELLLGLTDDDPQGYRR